MGKLFQNATGIIFNVDTGMNILGATTVELIVKKPDESVVKWKGKIVNNRFITYVTQEGDLDQVGTYILQAHVITSDGNEYFGDIVKFYVYPPITSTGG